MKGGYELAHSRFRLWQKLPFRLFRNRLLQCFVNFLTYQTQLLLICSISRELSSIDIFLFSRSAELLIISIGPFSSKARASAWYSKSIVFIPSMKLATVPCLGIVFDVLKTWCVDSMRFVHLVSLSYLQIILIFSELKKYLCSTVAKYFWNCSTSYELENVDSMKLIIDDDSTLKAGIMSFCGKRGRPKTFLILP